MNVFLGSCVHESKEYAMARWCRSIYRLPYIGEIVAVDTSPTTDFYERWRKEVPTVYLGLDAKEPKNRRIALGMEFLRQSFLRRNFQWWLNVECDMVIGPEVVEMMLAKADHYDFVSVPYPSRTENKVLETSFGCCLFGREYMKGEDFSKYPAEDTPDASFQNHFRGSQRCLRSALRLEHLGS